jgi:hypothetical protein
VDGAQDGSIKKKTKISFKFNQGFSNAVKRIVFAEEFA